MAKKAENRDILAGILSGVQEDVVEGLDTLYEIIRLESRQPLKSDDYTRNDALSKTNPKKPKKKASHYLTQNVFDELSAAKINIRELLPSIPKSKVTKSNIVDIAIRAILEEYKTKGLKSALIKKVLLQKTKTKSFS
jgi:hypothetical protein